MISSPICRFPRSITIYDDQETYHEHKYIIHVVVLEMDNLTFRATFNEDYSFIHEEDVSDSTVDGHVYNKIKNRFFRRDDGVVIEYGDYRVAFKTEGGRNVKDCILIHAFEKTKPDNENNGFYTIVNIVDKTYRSFNCMFIDDGQEQFRTEDVTVTFC